ncbi:MAG: hypothetical protein CVU73_08330 [Deltaproteobacteria bacterium HGW-Deltaproteobacteria-8]|nr:MAG: hypothetical protein CVU73_08330 [Deltaproteobacteria bacterium HGW-Deltaproteobacteria-8]
MLFALAFLLHAFMLLPFSAHLRRAHALSLHAFLPRKLFTLVLVPHAFVALALLSSGFFAQTLFPPVPLTIIVRMVDWGRRNAS